MIFAKITPPAVSKTNAKSPRRRISSVCGARKASACIFEATVIPSKSVTRFARTFCALSESEFKTPHSRSRFPNIRKPISATLLGETSPTITVIIMGKRIFVLFEIVFEA